MAQFHFVEDYEILVKDLLSKHPRDDAMSIAVGGSYHEMGNKCADLLITHGLMENMNVLDFGCGSGRVCVSLSQKVDLNTLVGIDIVQDLLEYAAEKSPENYQFIKSQSLNIPVEDDTFDYVYAFSVFTHLLQSEIYIYSYQIFKKLKSGGKFMFSFLEFDHHWKRFEEASIQHTIAGKPTPHLDMFLDRNQIEMMFSKLGFELLSYIEPMSDNGIGQSAVVFQKP